MSDWKIYQLGIYVNKDYTFYYYSLSAKGEYSHGIIMLCYCYFNGFGTSIDNNDAQYNVAVSKKRLEELSGILLLEDEKQIDTNPTKQQIIEKWKLNHGLILDGCSMQSNERSVLSLMTINCALIYIMESLWPISAWGNIHELYGHVFAYKILVGGQIFIKDFNLASSIQKDILKLYLIWAYNSAKDDENSFNNNSFGLNFLPRIETSNGLKNGKLDENYENFDERYLGIANFEKKVEFGKFRIFQGLVIQSHKVESSKKIAMNIIQVPQVNSVGNFYFEMINPTTKCEQYEVLINKNHLEPSLEFCNAIEKALNEMKPLNALQNLPILESLNSYFKKFKLSHFITQTGNILEKDSLYNWISNANHNGGRLLVKFGFYDVNGFSAMMIPLRESSINIEGCSILWMIVGNPLKLSVFSPNNREIQVESIKKSITLQPNKSIYHIEAQFLLSHGYSILIGTNFSSTNFYNIRLVDWSYNYLDLYVCILRSDYGSSLKIDHGRTMCLLDLFGFTLTYDNLKYKPFHVFNKLIDIQSMIKQHSKDDDDVRLISSEGSTVLKADDQNVQESPKQEITIAAVPITKFHLLISEIETAFNEMLDIEIVAEHYKRTCAALLRVIHYVFMAALDLKFLEEMKIEKEIGDVKKIRK
ncbi:9599_t:CDS:10 [Funneliformis caledonium]|uniref:9599_t:CDS:1 n=1 Tax=Funneliformis caledonium TaxID=1117310 RepID=A0A9N9CZ13_9GLOM|nr:9599_t:CDS:10 [Funneliformis caledonium]